MTEFSLLLGVGASFGLLRVTRNRAIPNPVFWLTAGLLTLLGALVGARLGYVLPRSGFYFKYPLEILLISSGGLSAGGALWGGILAAWFVAHRRRAPLGAFADGLFPLIPTLAVLAWMGCWAAGAAYGPVLANGGFGIPVRDETGLLAIRWPVQPVAALTLAVYYALLELRLPQMRPGKLAVLGLLGLALNLFGFSFLQADAAPAWQGLRLEAWTALAVVPLCGLAWLALVLRNSYRRKQLKKANA